LVPPQAARLRLGHTTNITADPQQSTTRTKNHPPPTRRKQANYLKYFLALYTSILLAVFRVSCFPYFFLCFAFHFYTRYSKCTMVFVAISVTGCKGHDRPYKYLILLISIHNLIIRAREFLCDGQTLINSTKMKAFSYPQFLR